MAARLSKLTRDNLERLATGMPMKMRRGRLGVWIPGDPPLPMVDIHPARYRSEEVEGVTLVSLAARQPWAPYLIHVPNGGGRSASVRITAAGKRVRYSVEAAKLKAQGVRPGVSDYLLTIAMHPHHALWLELKASDGTPTADQVAWLALQAAAGYAGCVAYGADAALEAIRRYVNGQWPAVR